MSTTVINSKLYPQLLTVIQETEPDITSIDGARFDEDGNIIAIASDGTTQYAIKIDDSCDVRPINGQAQFSSPEKIAPDLVDSYVDQLKQQFPFKPWLQQAKELLMQSPSLEDYSAKLVDLYPEMPSDDFNQIMLDALTAASMAGYFDADAEMGQPEAEFARIPEGTTRRRDGVDYVLRDSRWHKAEVQNEPQKKNPNTSEQPQSMS